jgi:hypothetical protein
VGFGDIFAFGFTLFAIALIAVVGYTIWNVETNLTIPGNSILPANPFNHTYDSPDGTIHIDPSFVGRSFFGALDWIILFIAVSLVIGMFVAGFMLPSHPVFTLVTIVACIIWLIIAPFFSNAYLQVLSLPILSSAADQFPMTNILIMNLPLVGLIAGVLAGVATYGKGQAQQTPFG